MELLIADVHRKPFPSSRRRTDSRQAGCHRHAGIPVRAAGSRGPEAAVLGLLDPTQLQARLSGVQLQVDVHPKHPIRVNLHQLTNSSIRQTSVDAFAFGVSYIPGGLLSKRVSSHFAGLSTNGNPER